MAKLQPGFSVFGGKETRGCYEAFDVSGGGAKGTERRLKAKTVRITGGAWRGRKIRGPGRSQAVRPSGSRLREALFNTWAPLLPGSRCLDLFAGVGTLGLEALSRGAEHATFVEQNPAHARWLRQNLELLQCQEQARVLVTPVGRALECLRREASRYDLIVADPPYDWPHLDSLLQGLKEAGLLAPGGQLALEHALRSDFSCESWELLRYREYGDTGLTILCLQGESDEFKGEV